MRRRALTSAALAVGFGLLGSCGGSDDSEPAVLTSSTTAATCPAQPDDPPVEVSPAHQAVLPPGTVITRSDAKDATTELRGSVPLDPTAVYDYYAGSTKLELLGGEDEGHEAEVLATDGQTRVSLKVESVCAGKSSIRAVVADELESTTTTT